MSPSAEIASYVGLVLVGLGVAVGAMNWYWGIKRFIRTSGPSSIFLISPLLVVMGAFLMPDQPLLKYLWLILLIDYTLGPLLLLQLFEKLRRRR